MEKRERGEGLHRSGWRSQGTKKGKKAALPSARPDFPKEKGNHMAVPDPRVEQIGEEEEKKEKRNGTGSYCEFAGEGGKVQLPICEGKVVSTMSGRASFRGRKKWKGGKPRGLLFGGGKKSTLFGPGGKSARSPRRKGGAVVGKRGKEKGEAPGFPAHRISKRGNYTIFLLAGQKENRPHSNKGEKEEKKDGRLSDFARPRPGKKKPPTSLKKARRVPQKAALPRKGKEATFTYLRCHQKEKEGAPSHRLRRKEGGCLLQPRSTIRGKKIRKPQRGRRHYQFKEWVAARREADEKRERAAVFLLSRKKELHHQRSKKNKDTVKKKTTKRFVLWRQKK